jgi:hypothetical protein
MKNPSGCERGSEEGQLCAREILRRCAGDDLVVGG